MTMHSILTLDLNWFYTRVSNVIKPHVDLTHEPGIYFKNKTYPITNDKNLFYTGNNLQVNLFTELPKDNSLGDIVDIDHCLVATREQINRGYINTIPFLPILPAEILISYLDAWQVINNPHRELYFNDKIQVIEDSILSIDSSIKHPEDVIESMLNIPTDVLEQVNDMYNEIFSEFISDFMNNNLTSYYKFNIDTTLLTCIRGDDIRAIRYEMAVENITYSKKEDRILNLDVLNTDITELVSDDYNRT